MPQMDEIVKYIEQLNQSYEAIKPMLGGPRAKAKRLQRTAKMFPAVRSAKAASIKHHRLLRDISRCRKFNAECKMANANVSDRLLHFDLCIVHLRVDIPVLRMRNAAKLVMLSSGFTRSTWATI